MSVIETLITNRTRSDVSRLEYLSGKGFGQMTESERHEWIYGNDLIYWADGEVIICLDGDVLIDGVSNKGAYNIEDLNRVTEALEYLDARLALYGYSTGYEPIVIDGDRTVWEVEDIPSESQMEQYLSNVEKIRSVLELYYATPRTPDTMDGFSFEEANDIETILSVVDEIITQVANGFKRSNAPYFWSGNEPLPTALSYMGRTWKELDEMHTTWRNWQVSDWYLLLYGNLKAEGDVV